MQKLFAATIFLSSFLLFLIQPLIAKQILPWFGGAASRASHPADSDGTADTPRPRDFATWAFLAAVASAMLLAVSNHIIQNIASIPFLWIAPLGLYLASFILCFEGDGWYRRGPYLALLAAALVAMAWFLDSLNLKTAVPVYLAGLFLICMFCHGEIAAARPGVRHLTGFYLAVSFSLPCARRSPFLARIAQIKHLSAALISHQPTDEEEALQYASSDWVVLSRDGAILERPSVAAAARLLSAPEGTPLWTDDFNNLLRVLR